MTNQSNRVYEGQIVDREAIEIGELYEKARTSIVDSVRYQIECGHRLAEKKRSLPHGAWLPWLEANSGVLGFSSRRTASMLLRAAGALNGKSTAHLTESDAVEISRKMWGNDNTIATKHTGDQESYTPAQYIEAAREVLGGIDLDPASNLIAQEMVRAEKWYGVDDDGLAQPWAGRVFLNPPYAYPLIEHFIEKLCAEIQQGNVTAAVLLTNDNSDTKWWHLAAIKSLRVCHTLGRINFYKADGEVTQPTNGQSFFYFGDEAASFARVFRKFGLIMMVDNGVT